MFSLKKVKEQGLSLKLTSTLMLVVSIIIMLVLLVTTFLTFRSFTKLEKATDTYISMEDAASELMSASDYLTDEVQCYTVIGTRIHMENYFNEAQVVMRRNHAIERMEAEIPDSPALISLKEAMGESVSLMDREYYAMRLVLEAQGDTDIPEALQDVVLSEEDLALSPEEQIAKARSMTHDSVYYTQKDHIRLSLEECISKLAEETHGDQTRTEQEARNGLISMACLILVQSFAIFSMLWLTTRLGIKPVLSAVDHIKNDQSLPVIGASEFRYLAGTYNVMYAAYKKSIANLNFKASHDELTGVYNRSGYELIKESLDMSSTALMIVDADRFKDINDVYGHEVGDQVLKRIANTLKRSFRSDDYVCRIGGDEFVVFMVHIENDPRELIERKVMDINSELSNADGDIPPITLSAGVSFDPTGADPAELFRRADTSLYHVKENGRNGFCFYTDELADIKRSSAE